MPSNIISINSVPEYNIPDKKMEELLEFLRKNGHPLDKDTQVKLTSKCNPLIAYSG